VRTVESADTPVQEDPSLCFPDRQKSCFACCPPIRPPSYEHIQHENMVKRMLRENTRAFGTVKGISPITGFSCWALGYLDQACRLVGCLLHPAQNSGVDLRYRVDYGEKCRRESCPEAKVFSSLSISERKFWISLTRGLDSFSYSSRGFNPLFKLMGWGAEVLHGVYDHEGGRPLSREAFFQTYPIFSTPLNARANAYLLTRMVTSGPVERLKTEAFRLRFEAFSGNLNSCLQSWGNPGLHARHTHLLKGEPLFLDFLRLSAGIKQMDPKGAETLKVITDQHIEAFIGRL